MNGKILSDHRSGEAACQWHAFIPAGHVGTDRSGDQMSSGHFDGSNYVATIKKSPCRRRGLFYRYGRIVSANNAFFILHGLSRKHSCRNQYMTFFYFFIFYLLKQKLTCAFRYKLYILLNAGNSENADIGFSNSVKYAQLHNAPLEYCFACLGMRARLEDCGRWI